MKKKINEQRLIDMVRVYDIFGDDEASIQEFFQSYVDSTNVLLTDIQSAIKNKDEKLAKTSFLRLKGISGNSGIMLIHQLSHKAEERVVKKDWEEVQNLFKDIQKAFNKLKERLAEQSLL